MILSVAIGVWKTEIILGFCRKYFGKKIYLLAVHECVQMRKQ